MWKQETYQKAIDFAVQKHTEVNQKVPGKNYGYVVHLSNVAAEAARAMFDETPDDLDVIIQAALLHDVLEDTNAAPDVLAEEFGAETAKIVKVLTKSNGLPKDVQMTDSLERIAAVGKPAAIVKLCDRITNLQEPPRHWSSDKKLQYLHEAELIHEKLSLFHEYLGNRLKSCINRYQEYL